MTPQEQKQFLQSTGKYIREQVAKEVAAQLEQFQFKGTWTDGHVYSKHNVVQYSGSAWICLRDNVSARPSTDEMMSWAILAKRGRDAK
jgi:hypothetical protein